MSMHCVLVVPHHAHFDAMKDILLECKECGFCKLHLYATYRNNEELRTNSPKGVDANSVRVKSLKGDVNEFVTLDYTVGRPDLKSILVDWMICQLQHLLVVQKHLSALSIRNCVSKSVDSSAILMCLICNMFVNKHSRYTDRLNLKEQVLH